MQNENNRKMNQHQAIGFSDQLDGRGEKGKKVNIHLSSEAEARRNRGARRLGQVQELSLKMARHERIALSQDENQL